MVSCAIVTCKKRTELTSITADGISFHRFPKTPEEKSKWITATGRGPHWWPTKTSTICSSHFQERDFRPFTKHRRLFDWAIPTLKLPHFPTATIPDFNTEALTDIVDSSELQREVSMESDKQSLKKTSTVTCKMGDTSLVNIGSEIKGSSSNLPFQLEYPKHVNSLPCQKMNCDCEVLESAKSSLLIDSPRKKKLQQKIEQCQNLIKKQRSKIKTLQTKSNRYKKKIAKLENVLTEIKGKQLVTSDQASQWENLGVNDLIRRYEEKQCTEKPSKTKYSPALRAFACTLHFYSPKAYDYVRQKFDTCLPHSRTIKKWYESVDADPGFTKESFDSIKLKVQGTEHKLLGNLVIDEMSIRQRIEWDGKQMHGYVDICNSTKKGDYLSEAKQALVFLVTAINGAFKVPVGYFLVDGVTGEQRASLVKQCLELLHETGIIITSMTFDGCSANITMAKELGCLFNPDDLKSYFLNPVDGRPVYVFLDPCHMLKLIRNAFEANGLFIDNLNRRIEWRHIVNLNDMQEKELLHLGNKLRRAHIQFKNQKMKVRLASQLLSNSVADALTFCGFENVEGTVSFVRLINNLFDVLNSRHIGQFEFKKPICQVNKDKVFSFLEKCSQYLLTLKVNDGVRAVNSSRKTGFVGFLTCIQSIKAMYLDLVEKDKLLVYIPAYKISQDHLELLFGQIRSHGGCNTNPTARQFQAIYKKLIVRNEVRDIEKGNCKALEELSILTCSSSVQNINLTIDRRELECDADAGEEDSLEQIYEQAVFDEEIDILVQNFSRFGAQAITYIAGFIAHALLRKLKCDTCASALITMEPDTNKHSFIKIKDKGGLKYPSDSVIDICKRMEGAMKKMILSENKINTSTKNIKQELIAKVLPHFIGQDLFKDINAHQYEQSPMDNHITLLTKAVMEKYLDTRLHYLTKNAKPKLSKRQILNKYLHFTGQ